MGNQQRVPIRTGVCIIQDFCDTTDLIYDPEGFTTAASREEVCKLGPGIAIEDEFKDMEDVPWNATSCSRARSQVRICPKKLMQERGLDKNEYLVSVNEELRKLRRQLRKKNTKKKSRKRKMKKRRRKRKRKRKK